MDNRFDIGDRSLRGTFDHLIGCMEGHTDFMLTRSETPAYRESESIDGLLKRLTIVAKDFAEFAAKVQREGRSDEMATNPRTGNCRSLGGVIGHVITHGMHHRAQIMYLFEQLGVNNVIEGDLLSWEAVTRGWGWEDGGSYGAPTAG
jgi:uncharacterized damage-inducible protein DinB